jgi:hypothetical protein
VDDEHGISPPTGEKLKFKNIDGTISLRCFHDREDEKTDCLFPNGEWRFGMTEQDVLQLINDASPTGGWDVNPRVLHHP